MSPFFIATQRVIGLHPRDLTWLDAPKQADATSSSKESGVYPLFSSILAA